MATTTFWILAIAIVLVSCYTSNAEEAKEPNDNLPLYESHDSRFSYEIVGVPLPEFIDKPDTLVSRNDFVEPQGSGLGRNVNRRPHQQRQSTYGLQRKQKYGQQLDSDSESDEDRQCLCPCKNQRKQSSRRGGRGRQMETVDDDSNSNEGNLHGRYFRRGSG